MTEQQAFKFAFLMQAARDGLSEAETVALIDRLERGFTEKRADMIGDGAKAIGSGVTGLIGHLAGAAVPVAIGGSALAGGALGALAAKLREGSFDVDAAKKQELIAAYNSFADEADHVGRARRPRGSTIRLPLN